jgi:Ubiquitin family/Ring finger domain
MLHLGFFSLVSLICQASIPVSLDSDAAEINDFLQKFSSDNLFHLIDVPYLNPVTEISFEDYKLLFKLAKITQNISFAISLVSYIHQGHRFQMEDVLEIDDLEFFVSLSTEFAETLLHSNRREFWSQIIIPIALKYRNDRLFRRCLSYLTEFPGVIEPADAAFVEENSVLECNICLESFTSLMEYVDACGKIHMYHKECLRRHLETRSDCPECRKPLSSIFLTCLSGGLSRQFEISADVQTHINRLFDCPSEDRITALYDFAVKDTFYSIRYMERLRRSYPQLDLAKNYSLLLRKLVQSNLHKPKLKNFEEMVEFYLETGSDINVGEGVMLWRALRDDREDISEILRRYGAKTSLKLLLKNTESKSLVYYCVTEYKQDCILPKEILQKYATVKTIAAIFETQTDMQFLVDSFSEVVYEEDVAEYLKDKHISCMTLQERDQSKIDAALQLAVPSAQKIRIVFISGKDVEFDAFPWYTVYYLKFRISEEFRYEQSEIDLLFQNTALEDDRTLESYGIINNSVILLLVSSDFAWS